MAKIVDFQDYRNRSLEKRSFSPWQKRFREKYINETRVADLSDSTLFFLAGPGENSTTAFYELIMGIWDLGTASKFHYLSNDRQMMVVDTHLFLADQVRFEMMQRLGWITNLPGEDLSIIEVVLGFVKHKDSYRRNPPALAESHPDYESYENLTKGDQEVFIRQKLEEALEMFTKRLEP